MYIYVYIYTGSKEAKEVINGFFFKCRSSLYSQLSQSDWLIYVQELALV